VHKGRTVGRSSTFQNLPKRKQAGLKVRSGGRAIRCVVLRCIGYMGMKLRNQVVQIALRFYCRWIGQPVERCPNNQQAQQTRHDLGSHSFVALCIYPSGTSVAYGNCPDSNGIPSSYDATNSMGDSLRPERIHVQRNGNRPRTLAGAVVVSWSETSEERRVKPNLTVSKNQ
jgi:hypothetical protein